MTADEQNIARTIVNQWFWQPAEGHNYHYRGALRTLVRFFESAPMEPDVMRLVIEYLRDEVIDGGISLMNRTVDLGTGWKAMDAWYRTDETEKWNGTDSRKVRVYQVLVQKPADGDAVDGPYQVDKGCRYRVTHTFSWNVEALPAVPASSSGVSYALEAVVRDQETGLYNCVLTKRERMQQDVAEYISDRTVFQRTKEEQHLGVKEADLPTTGKSARAGGGTMVRRRITKNEDCTSDVLNETISEMPVQNAVVEYVRGLHGTQQSVTHRNQSGRVSSVGLKIGERRSSRTNDGGTHDNTIVTMSVDPAGNVAANERKTIFEEQSGRRKNIAAGGKLPEREADEAGSGKTHSVDVQLNDDGTADVTTTDTEEKPVQNAVVEFRKTLHGTQKSVTHRNQPQPVSESGMKIGEMRTTRKTDGGLNDNTVVTMTDEPAGDVATGDRKTIFESVKSRRKNVAANGEMPERSAAEAGGGETHSVDVQLNEDGTADIVTNDTTEKPVSDAVVEIRKTARSTVRTVTHRNQPQPVSESGMKIGEMRTTRKTDGGLFDNSSTIDHEDYDGDLAVETSEDSASKRVSITKAARPEIDTEPEAPTPNRVVRKSARMNEHGTWDETTETTTFKEHVGYSETQSGDVMETVEDTSFNTETNGSTGSASPNEVRTIIDTPNDHGTWTHVERHTTYHEKSSTSVVETPTEIAVTTVTHNSLTASDSVTNGRLSIVPNEHGSFTVTKTEITPKKVDTGWIRWEAKEYTETKIKYYVCGLRIFKNFDTPPTPLGFASFDFQVTINEYGKFDGCMSYKRLVNWEWRGNYGW